MSSALRAVTEIGTSCSEADVRCAVTVTSVSTRSLPVFCAMEAVAAVAPRVAAMAMRTARAKTGFMRDLKQLRKGKGIYK